MGAGAATTAGPAVATTGRLGQHVDGWYEDDVRQPVKVRATSAALRMQVRNVMTATPTGGRHLGPIRAQERAGRVFASRLAASTPQCCRPAAVRVACNARCMQSASLLLTIGWPPGCLQSKL